MSKANYTVAFGDLKISVQSNKSSEQDADEVVQVEECSSSFIHQKPLNGKDEQLVRAIYRSRVKENNKRVVRDNEFWDKLHENAVHDQKSDKMETTDTVTETETKRPIYENVHQKGLKVALVPKTVKGKCIDNNERWIDTLPESVRCVIDSDAMQEERNSSTMLWSNQVKDDGVRLEEFFMGSNHVQPVQSVSCWNCATDIDLLHFRQFPHLLPFRYQQGSEYFMVKGYFCCWECVRVYIIEHGLSHLAGMLGAFLSKLYGKVIQIRPYCGKYSLEKFGGNCSYELYMKNIHVCNNERVTHLLQWHPTINGCVKILSKKFNKNSE